MSWQSIQQAVYYDVLRMYLFYTVDAWRDTSLPGSVCHVYIAVIFCTHISPKRILISSMQVVLRQKVGGGNHSKEVTGTFDEKDKTKGKSLR